MFGARSMQPCFLIALPTPVLAGAPATSVYGGCGRHSPLSCGYRSWPLAVAAGLLTDVRVTQTFLLGAGLIYIYIYSISTLLLYYHALNKITVSLDHPSGWAEMCIRSRTHRAVSVSRPRAVTATC